MPALTVADFTVLPRVGTVNPLNSLSRPLRSITTAPQGFEGEGFPVRRAFAGIAMEDADPFIMMDQMGEVEYAPGEPKGTPWHPHRGFETVTYIIDGAFDHRDSHGGGGTITNGDTQWMTAGGGILHIETPPESLVVSGGLFHGFQLWVNLPREQKWAAPRYQDLRATDVGLLTSSDGGALIRVIAGSLESEQGPIHGPGSTYTPITILHVTLSAGAEVTLPWRADFNALAYTMNGRGVVGREKRPIQMGQLALFGAGDSITLGAQSLQESRAKEVDFVILGGAPIRESIAWMGPFVMNTKAEVLQAFEDHQKGRLGVKPAEHATTLHTPHAGAPTTVREN